MPEPVPVNGTGCGLFGALSVYTTSAVRVPVVVGDKVTEIVQLAPGGSVVPMQLSVPIVKSSVLPLVATLLKNSEASPLFGWR